MKQMILAVDPKQKKKRGAEWFELDSDLDEAWVLEHQAFLVQEQRTKIEKKFKKENKSKKVEPEGKGPSVEKYEANIQKLDERIASARLQAEDREGNKEVALGTSKIVSSMAQNLPTSADKFSELH
jgi:DNA topoisomerase-1